MPAGLVENVEYYTSRGPPLLIFLSNGNPGDGAASPRQLPVVLFWRNKESFMRYTADQFRQSYVDCRMKILVLTKRQYMGKDLLDDRFGRFWEVPLELARRGHEVRGFLSATGTRATGSFCSASGALTWHSLNLLNSGLPALQNYLRYARRILNDFTPDIVWACSDAFHAIFGRHVSAGIGAKCVIDLYDNFESYPATRVPGVLSLFKRALKAANGITCVSSQISRLRERSLSRPRSGAGAGKCRPGRPILSARSA